MKRYTVMFSIHYMDKEKKLNVMVSYFQFLLVPETKPRIRSSYRVQINIS